MAVIGQVSVPVASWCTLWFFRPLFWLSMLSVAEVHCACRDKVWGSCLVPFQRAMSCIVYCRVRLFQTVGGMCICQRIVGSRMR